MHLTLHTRYEVMGGRRFRIREFTDGEIELRMLIAWAIGLAMGIAPSVWTLWRHWPTL